MKGGLSHIQSNISHHLHPPPYTHTHNPAPFSTHKTDNNTLIVMRSLVMASDSAKLHQLTEVGETTPLEGVIKSCSNCQRSFSQTP